MSDELKRRREQEIKALEAQLRADKRKCACGRDAEVMVCEHLYYGMVTHWNFSYCWVGYLFCDGCEYTKATRENDGYPKLKPICKHCTRLIFEYCLASVSITHPPGHYLLRSKKEGRFPRHWNDDFLQELTDEEKKERSGPYKWARPGHLEAV